MVFSRDVDFHARRGPSQFSFLHPPHGSTYHGPFSLNPPLRHAMNPLSPGVLFARTPLATIALNIVFPCHTQLP